MRLLKTIIARLLWMAVMVGALGCTNLLNDMADKTSDRARLYQAKMLINQKDFTGAISQITGMTATGQAAETARVTLASAYAGRCGLDAINMAVSLTTGAGNLLNVLLAAFPGATASTLADCTTARGIMTSISSLSTDESVFLAMVAFATIGSELSVDYDKDGDSVVDSGKAWCKATQPVAYPRTTPAPMSDADAVDVFVNLAYVIQGLSAASSSIGGSSYSSIQTLCAGLADPTICTNTDSASYTSNEILYLRGVIASQAGIGLGICPDTAVNCTCLP